jgi:(p)ppGpp synthase/HD superfamily hydrolase
MKLVRRAREIAEWWHDGIARKTSGPYITHPENVVRLVDGESEIVQAAAWLHDVLEDPDKDGNYITRERLLEKLISEQGQLIGVGLETAIKVLNLVQELTNVYTKKNYPRLDRKTRKIFELMRLHEISREAQTIKVADIIDNSKDLEQLGDFGPTYLVECEDKLSVLTQARPALIVKAEEQLKRYDKNFRNRS